MGTGGNARQASQHLLRELLQQFTEGSPFGLSIGNLARMVMRSLSTHASPIGASLGSGAPSTSAKRRPPQSRY